MPELPPEEAGPSRAGLSPPARSLLRVLAPARTALARSLIREQPAVTEPDLNGAITGAIFQALVLKTGEACGFVAPGTLALLAESDGIRRRMGRACSDAGVAPEDLFARGPGVTARTLPPVPDGAARELLGALGSPGVPVFGAGFSVEDLAAALELFVAERMQVAEGYRVHLAGKSALLYTGTVDIPPEPVLSRIARPGFRAGGARSGAGPKTGAQILDPACGAGLVLLAAYRELVARGADRHTALAGSLFGTDIDPESAGAARLVLLLAFVDAGIRAESGPGDPAAIRACCRALACNIRCGNALIAPDYFSGRQEHPFNAEERRRVNAFSWQEAYPAILAAGGFDAVIGAPPPYRPLGVRTREEYFQTHYDAYAPGAGLFTYFIERGLSLLRPGGTLAFLVPESFLRSGSTRPLRRLLLTRRILRIADTGRSRLLQEGDTRMYLLALANEAPVGPFPVELADAGMANPGAGRERMIDQRSLSDGGWTLGDRRAAVLAERLRARGTPLDHYVMGEIVAGTAWKGPAIVAPECSPLPAFTYVRDDSTAPGGPVVVIERDDPYLAGILTSSLARFLIRALCPATGCGYRLSPACIGKIPVVTPDLDTRAERSRHDRLAALVMLRVSLADFANRARPGQERRLVQQEIGVTDVKIDALVYELYGLTPEEIAVIGAERV